MTAQMFFTTRSTARAASFGKMVDNGTQADNRWGRKVELKSTGDKTLSVGRGVRKNGCKAVTIVTKKMKTLAH